MENANTRELDYEALPQREELFRRRRRRREHGEEAKAAVESLTDMQSHSVGDTNEREQVRTIGSNAAEVNVVTEASDDPKESVLGEWPKAPSNFEHSQESQQEKVGACTFQEELAEVENKTRALCSPPCYASEFSKDFLNSEMEMTEASSPSRKRRRSSHGTNSNYEYLDHTADVQLHAWGADLEEAFEQVVVCMFGYMTDLSKVDVDPDHQSVVEVQGHDMVSLLYNLMDEFLFQFCTEDFVAKRVEIAEFDRENFRIKAHGNIADENGTHGVYNPLSSYLLSHEFDILVDQYIS